MTVLQLIDELMKYYLADVEDIPIHVTKTKNGMDFWPDELYVEDISVVDGKLYLG